MGSDKKIIELIYVFFIIVFSEILFSASIRNSMHNIRYFMASRTDKDFHLMAYFQGKSVVLYDKTKKVGEINIDDIPQKTSITKVFHRLYKARERFNIHIDRKTNTLYIYSQQVIPSYTFLLNGCPDENLSPAETIKTLDSFYQENKSMNEKLILTLTYLGFTGCLSEKLFILYKEMLVVMNRSGKKFFFGIDFKRLMPMITHISGVSEEKYSANEFLIAFKIHSNMMIFYTPEGGIARGYSMQENSLKKRFTGFFSPQKDIEIKIAVENDDYEKLVGMVDDNERIEARTELFSLVEGLKKSSFFSIYFLAHKDRATMFRI